MNYIYTNTRNNRQYVLDPQTTMGEKVCLVDMASGDDKFVSPKTLKRWYSLTRTEDIVVEVKAFTGMMIGLFRVIPWDNNQVAVMTKKNKVLTFDLETLKQTNANNPKFANRLGLDYNFLESTLKWAVS